MLVHYLILLRKYNLSYLAKGSIFIMIFSINKTIYFFAKKKIGAESLAITNVVRPNESFRDITYWTTRSK